MSIDENLIEEVQALLMERSNKAITLARQAVLNEEIKYSPLKEALAYFMQELWFNAAHPALMSLTCEEVGGEPDITTELSAAIVLLTGAADIHDDIIDQSATKDSKPTVYGRYGQDIAIIAGDILWFKGMLSFSQTLNKLPNYKANIISELAKQSFFDIGSVEAKEAKSRRNLDLKPEEYLDIIGMKISIARASAKIGAIMGDGDETEINNLGLFAEKLAFLMTIRDEFADLFEIDERKNRFCNECLPLPILYAFEDEALKNQILQILSKENLTNEDVERIVDLVVNSAHIRELGTIISRSVKEATDSIVAMKNKDKFEKLLNCSILDLPIN